MKVCRLAWQGPSKEEAVRLALSALRSLAAVEAAADAEEPPELAAAAAELSGAALPDKLLRRAVAAMFDQALAEEGTRTSLYPHNSDT